MVVKINSLVVKCGCHCVYTNEDFDSGNQESTSGCRVSFKQKSLTIILLSIFFLSVSHCLGLWDRFTKISKFLDYDETCTNEGIRRENFEK